MSINVCVVFLQYAIFSCIHCQLSRSLATSLFNELISSGLAASTNMFFILVNELYKSATLFIISSYRGLSNSSAYNTCNTPSQNCTTTMPNGDEPKPGSIPIDCC